MWYSFSLLNLNKKNKIIIYFKSTEGQLKNDSDEYQNEIVSYESLNR